MPDQCQQIKNLSLYPSSVKNLKSRVVTHFESKMSHYQIERFLKRDSDWRPRSGVTSGQATPIGLPQKRSPMLLYRFAWALGGQRFDRHHPNRLQEQRCETLSS